MDWRSPFIYFYFQHGGSGSGRENRAGAIKEINVYGKSGSGTFYSNEQQYGDRRFRICSRNGTCSRGSADAADRK